jgi:Domain of unknown function (DUF4276)
MIRLYVMAEGLTEANFVSQLLKPHLELRMPGGVAVRAPRLDGHYTYAGLKKDARRLLGAAGSGVVVTTMIDLFKIARDFPGISDPANAAPPQERVRHLEERCRADFGDERFVPYIQLHEFEALVLSDLPVLAEQHPNRRRAIRELAARLDRKFESPEHVDRLEPPSYRIRAVVPEYQKAVDGVITTTKIGLSKLRQRCQHFGGWLDALERVGTG